MDKDPLPKPFELSEAVESAAVAFRGYNVTNLGRTPELLAHHTYGPVFVRYLREASEICSRVLDEPIDLVARVRDQQESTLDTFGQDIGLIIAVELAQLEVLEEFFGVECRQARLAMGYSLGEVTALVTGGVYNMADVLPPLVSLSRDSADLGRDATLGIVFSRGPALDFAAIERLCLQITNQGQGVIAISAYLSPNTVLVFGQGDTVDCFKLRMDEVLDGNVHLRKNQECWPPMHTSLLWQRNIPNRAALMMQTGGGGFRAPAPPVVSLVTGKASYNDYNSRELLHRWVDHPQRLWDAIYEILAAGVEAVFHVGPAPNLIPATFKRLSDNVQVQLASRSLNSLGMRALSGMVNRPWLAKLMSARAALLRAPFVRHVIVEDWLLAQDVP